MKSAYKGSFLSKGFLLESRCSGRWKTAWKALRGRIVDYEGRHDKAAVIHLPTTKDAQRLVDSITLIADHPARWSERKEVGTMIDVKRTKNGQWYWRVKAANGKMLCHSETYMRKENALKGLQALYDAIDEGINVED